MPIGPNRPFRRAGAPFGPGRPFLHRGPLALGPRRMLRQANMLLQSGQFAEAASLFETLAKEASAAGLPFAPRLFLQAARATFRSGNAAQSVLLFGSAAEILIAAGAYGMLYQAGKRFHDNLLEKGFTKEAEEVQKYLSQVPQEAMAEAPKPSVVLPTHCSQCGAAIRSDEVDWIDEKTAECGYCGSPVRGE